MPYDYYRHRVTISSNGTEFGLDLLLTVSDFSTPIRLYHSNLDCGDRFLLESRGSLVRFPCLVTLVRCSLLNTGWNLCERMSALDFLSV